MAKNSRLIDLTGKRFGDLIVIRQAGNSPRGGALWLCRCACGTETKPAGGDLRTGKVRSCGHGKGARFRAQMTTHGASGTRLHRIWKGMKARCLPHRAGYGAKGIRVCDDWQRYDAFAAWAHANGYDEKLTIERKDNTGNYCPENCRWATVAEQAVNKRNVPLSPDGRPWSHVARANGISVAAYRTRVFEGWSLQDAATHQFGKKRNPPKRRADGTFAARGE